MNLQCSASSAQINGGCGVKPLHTKTMSRSQSAVFGERSKLYRRPKNERITNSPTQSRSGTLKPFKAERFDSLRGSLLRLPSRNLSLRKGYCFHHEKSPLKLTHIRHQTASCRFMDLQPPSLAVLPLPDVREGVHCKQQSDENDILFELPSKEMEPPPNFHRLSLSQTRNVAAARQLEPKLFGFKYLEEGDVREDMKKRVQRLTDGLNPSGNLTLLLQMSAPPKNSECVLSASLDSSLLGSAIHTARQLRQLLGAWASIEASQSIQQTADNIVESVRGLVSAERVSLYILDSSRCRLRLVSGIGDPHQLQDHLLRLGADIAAKTAECGRSIYVADVYQDADFHRKLDTITGFSTRDLLCVPIFEKTTRSVRGVIQLLSLDKYKISVDHQRVLMELFVDIASSALERSFQLRSTKRKEIIIDNLLKVSNLVGHVNGPKIPDNIFGVIVNAAKHLVGAQHAVVFVPDPINTNLLVLKSCRSNTQATIDASKGLLGYAYSHGQPINVKDASKDPRFDAETDSIAGFAVRELLIVPVKSRAGHTIALIQALNKYGESSLLSSHFSEEDMALLKNVSLSVGMILNREAVARS